MWSQKFTVKWTVVILSSQQSAVSNQQSAISYLRKERTKWTPKNIFGWKRVTHLAAQDSTEDEYVYIVYLSCFYALCTILTDHLSQGRTFVVVLSRDLLVSPVPTPTPTPTPTLATPSIPCPRISLLLFPSFFAYAFPNILSRTNRSCESSRTTSLLRYSTVSATCTGEESSGREKKQRQIKSVARSGRCGYVVSMTTRQSSTM